MTPYQPDEFRANHLFGCKLDPDHAGACLLDRPFRIRESGGREYLDEHEVRASDAADDLLDAKTICEHEVDEHLDLDANDMTMPGPDTRQRAEQFVRDALGPEYADDFDVPAIVDRLHDLAGSWDVGSVDTFDFWETCKAHDRSQDAAEPDDDAGREGSALHGEDGQVFRTEQVIPGPSDAPPLLDSTDAAVEEVRWIAREARALREVDDPERRARLVERKRRLLDFIEQQTGGRP